MGRWWQIVAGVATAAMVSGPPAAAQPTGGPWTEVPAGVRPMSPAVAAALAEGLQRSPTLRRIVNDIEEHRGLVLVEDASSPMLLRRGLTGATSHHILCDKNHRVIQVAVVTKRGDATIETLGHELQHAREMLASDATDATGVATLYQRIGVQTRHGTYETQMAQEAGTQVFREVRQSRR
jgi:hypothetical protein